MRVTSRRGTYYLGICRIGRYYPTKLHSRDSANPYFYTPSEEDTNTLCGGVVSGPYENPSAMDGPVRNGTDFYANDRSLWQASEAAVDYGTSVICGLLAYATMPDSMFQGCTARSPFTGRAV